MIAAALAVVLAPGCTILPELIGGTIDIPVAGEIVRAKVEPTELIADDGSTCTVSRGAWERAQVGRRYVCGWSIG
jgi:hypothetical protein